jgi:hypothetical protein
MYTAGEPIWQARFDAKNKLNPCSRKGFASSIIDTVCAKGVMASALIVSSGLLAVQRPYWYAV